MLTLPVVWGAAVVLMLSASRFNADEQLQPHQIPQGLLSKLLSTLPLKFPSCVPGRLGRVFLFMAALCNGAGHIYFHPVVCSSFFLLFSWPNFSRRRLDVYHTSTHGVALVRI